VASGQPCLGRFSVPKSGCVLLYAAEDAPHIVKTRLEGIAKARHIDLSTLNFQVITIAQLRLDNLQDIEALDKTIAALGARFLVLDPFVRLHRIDENSSSDVATILGNLRIMQRRHATSILLVHHAKKNGGATRAGQALRGSSEFHAWGDSNLYMRRNGEHLTLTVEHRAAPGIGEIPLVLHKENAALALQIDNEGTKTKESIAALSIPQRIEQALSQSNNPVSIHALRQIIGIRTATICANLKLLHEQGKIRKTSSGYILAGK
jgi:RecA-family ATPase